MAGLMTFGQAATTIDSDNPFAYGANVGWVDWRGAVSSGAVIGDYVCSGFIYSANVGWINLGSGAPADGVRYQNGSADDFGVNHDGLGNLRGYAWGANVGWINFESAGTPTVSLASGILSGHAYGANVGWISLSNAVAFVQTDSFYAGPDTDENGLPDPWERARFGILGVDPSADPDHDGSSNTQECQADTNPNDGEDSLRITTFERDAATLYTTLGWRARPTRLYNVQWNAALGAPSSPWTNRFSNAELPGWQLTGFSDPETNSFFRIRAHRPLTP
jgi:hypothetical protein